MSQQGQMAGPAQWSQGQQGSQSLGTDTHNPLSLIGNILGGIGNAVAMPSALLHGNTKPAEGLLQQMHMMQQPTQAHPTPSGLLQLPQGGPMQAPTPGMSQGQGIGGASINPAQMQALMQQLQKQAHVQGGQEGQVGNNAQDLQALLNQNLLGGQ